MDREGWKLITELPVKRYIDIIDLDLSERNLRFKRTFGSERFKLKAAYPGTKKAGNCVRLFAGLVIGTEVYLRFLK